MKSSVGAWFKKAQEFVLHDVWTLEIGSASSIKALLVRILRTAVLVIRGIRDDELPIRASALTYATLMSIVPLLGFIFAIFKGFGAAEQMQNVTAWMEHMPAEFQTAIQRILEVAQNTNLIQLGSFGLVIVLLTSIMVLSGVENSFNRIWGISRSRNILRRTTNYISILVVVPFLIIIASTVTATLQSPAIIEQLGAVKSVYRSLLQLTPAFTAWVAFTFLYVFMPNIRVKLIPALVSGFVGSLLWLGWQKIYIALQVGVARYSALYGTFASIPIFMVWLYVGWIIILLGAEVAYAAQNEDTYHLEMGSAEASVRTRIMLAIAIVVETARAQRKGQGTVDAASIAHGSRVPIRLINETVETLVKANILGEIADRPAQYTLLRSPDVLHVRDVYNVIVDSGSGPEVFGVQKMDVTVSDMMQEADSFLDEKLGHWTLNRFLEDPNTPSTC